MGGSKGIYINNSGVVAQAKEPRSHQKGKHIERKYHLICDIVKKGDVVAEKITSVENLVNLFTKTLYTRVFDGH